MDLFDEFLKLIEGLNEARIPYAVVGGIAMAFHDEPRFTKDIDLLIAEDAIESVRKIFEKVGYFESSAPWTFQSSNLTLHRFMRTQGEDFLVVDILVGHEPQFEEVIRNAIKEDTEAGTVRIARKEDLISMKQLRNSDQDQVDIKRLRNDKN